MKLTEPVQLALVSGGFALLTSLLSAILYWQLKTHKAVNSNWVQLTKENLELREALAERSGVAEPTTGPGEPKRVS